MKRKLVTLMGIILLSSSYIAASDYDDEMTLVGDQLTDARQVRDTLRQELFDLDATVYKYYMRTKENIMDLSLSRIDSIDAELKYLQKTINFIRERDELEIHSPTARIFKFDEDINESWESGKTEPCL